VCPRFAALLLPAAFIAACSGAMERPQDEAVSQTASALSSGVHAEIVHLFDGTDDRVTIPDHPAYALGSGDFTVEVVARIVDDGRYLVPLVSKRTGAYDGIYFTLYGSQLLLQMSGVPNYLSNSVPNMKDGGYHQFAVTRAAGLVTFYVDGVAQGTVNSTRSVNSNGPLYIGYDSYDDTGLRGNVRDVRLWSNARSATDLKATLATPPPSSTPGLIGEWGVSLGGGDVIVDQSPTGNSGYLGTQKPICDGQNPQIFVPSANRLTLRVSNPAARVEALSSDSCADILVDGTMQYFNTSDYSHSDDEIKNWFCDENNLKSVTSNKGDVGLDLEIDGAPIHVGANWENTSDYQTYHKFCADQSKHLDDTVASHWVYNLASPVIVNAWLACKGITGSGNSTLVQSQTLSSDQMTAQLGAAWHKLVTGQPAPVITGFSVSGGSCTGAFSLGTALDASPIGMTCTRSGNSDLFAVLTTTEGQLVWDFAETGMIGSASVTASVPTTTLDFVRQDCTQQYLTPSCHSGGFLGLGKQRCDRTQGTLTLYSATGEYQAPNSWCDGDCGESTADAITHAGPAALTLNFYVPPDARKYKKKDIPSVTYHLCANLFQEHTTVNSYTASGLSVYRGQSFVVSIPGNATDPILHLTIGNATQTVDLSQAGTFSGVTVLPGPANSVEKTYNVTVN
jgi:hypothetical protein